MQTASESLDFFDGRAMALMIAHTYACGWLSHGSIGSTWSPVAPGGKHWSEGKCRRVLDGIISMGLVTVHESLTGEVVRTNEAGFKFFDLSGEPAFSDAGAARHFGKSPCK